MKHAVRRCFLLLIAWICLSGFPGVVWALPMFAYDWNDGTLQGWIPESPFGGNLNVNPDFGNPGGSMFATDRVTGGSLLARAPSDLSGDLSIYQGIAWDEFIPDRGSATTVSTFVLIRGTDGTLYETDRTVGPVNTWNSKFASFNDLSAWSLLGGGTTSFSSVISEVDAVFISMDTSVLTRGAVESWVDNVVVNASTPVPEPTTSLLLGTSLLLLIGWKKIRNKKY